MIGNGVRTTLVEAKRVSKVFDGVAVLNNVDLDVCSGEIHALVGANGSGKSTLIKILAGYHNPTTGFVKICIDPKTGNSLKMVFVHQDLGLVESMTVLDNMAFTCGYTQGVLGRIRWRASRQGVADLLSGFGLEIEGNETIASLGGTERRLVAIARAISSLGDEVGVLVLDEPTAALPPEETGRVFRIMRMAAERGAGVLFVSHNLTETITVADRVTVLRDGRVVARVVSTDTTVDQLASDMFGFSKEIIVDADKGHTAAAGARLQRSTEGKVPSLHLERISSAHLRDITLDVWPGEIVGVTGLVGCGKSELGRIIAGCQKAMTGTISVGGGAPARFSGPHEAIHAGIAYVPPDRRRSGGIVSMDARENVTLSTLGDFFQTGWLRKRMELQAVLSEMAAVAAVPRNPKLKFGAFSGGNQQKLVFARVMRMAPRLVVLDDPTQGVDVGTVPDLYRFIRTMAADGCGVILVTADFDELVALSERVIVLLSGCKATELRGGDVTLEKVGMAVARGRQLEDV